MRREVAPGEAFDVPAASFDEAMEVIQRALEIDRMNERRDRMEAMRNEDGPPLDALGNATTAPQFWTRDFYGGGTNTGRWYHPFIATDTIVGDNGDAGNDVLDITEETG